MEASKENNSSTSGGCISTLLEAFLVVFIIEACIYSCNHDISLLEGAVRTAKEYYQKVDTLWNNKSDTIKTKEQ